MNELGYIQAGSRQSQFWLRYTVQLSEPRVSVQEFAAEVQTGTKELISDAGCQTFSQKRPRQPFRLCV